MNTINKLYMQESNEFSNKTWMYTEQKKAEKKQSKQLRNARQSKKHMWNIQENM